MNKTIYIFLMILTGFSCNEMTESDETVLYLNNGILRAGILPDVGGRMVFFGAADGNNMLKSDSTLWNESKDQRITPFPDSEFKAYNGLITWLGPQSQWWTNQEVNTNRLEEKSQWPPDPYLIYGTFSIINISDTSITLIGPDSPVSGVRLRKTYTLSGNKLHIHVEAENIRSSQISWDIWSNARFEGNTEFYVPVNDESLLRLITFDDETRQPLSYRIEEGVFTFIPEEPSDTKKRRLAKAFIHPEKEAIMVYRNPHVLMIQFDPIHRELMHPEQALVEVYNSFQLEPPDNLLELEHHSAFRTLQPGDKIELSETWSVYERDSTKNAPEQLETILSIKENE